MLLTKEVEILLTTRNIKKILDRYSLSNFPKVRDIVNISVSELVVSSLYIVNVSCNYCDYNLKLPYKKYLMGIKIINKTSCRNCFTK